MREKWADEMVAERLQPLIEKFGRMPTASEIREVPGAGDLASQVSRRGGFESWRLRLGLERKEHASAKGWKWEEWFVEQALARGLDAERQTRVKAPFDVMVNGKTVDVKVSRYAEYGRDNYVKGWAFNVHNKDRPDFLALVCLDAERFDFIVVIPTCEMTMARMVSIPATKRGKYGKYINRWDLLGAG